MKKIAGAVTDVVAHVVGDHTGVAGVVFGDTGFDFTDQVGADVGALGEDAAAETREDRDQRGTKAQCDQRFQDVAHLLFVVRVVHVAEHHVVAGDTQQGQADDQHAGHGTGFEGNFKTTRQTLGARRFGGAHVGADRDVHADVTGNTRQNRTDEETDGDRNAQQEAEADADNDADDADGQILTVQISGSAFLNGGCDFLHTLVTGRCRKHRADGIRPVKQRH